MGEKHPLTEALRAEIVKLANEGDAKKEGALTADVLLKIMRVAKTGRDLLVSMDANPSNLSNLVQKPRSPFSGGFLGASSAGDDDFGASEQSAAVAMPFAPAPFQENFGMTAIREIISAAKNLNGNGPTPARLVEALAIAKEKGLDDVARELEAQLGIPKKPVEIHKIEDKKPEPQKEAS
jgi:hypothetical protein